MSKKKADPKTFKVDVEGVELFYTLVDANGEYRAKFVWKGEILLTRWRVTQYPVYYDVVKMIRQKLEIEAQRAAELRKLEDWNAGRPIFGGGVEASPLIDNGSDGG